MIGRGPSERGLHEKISAELWWKNAVVYCVDVEFYQDSNGDGIGDFPGLTSRVDYLGGLGVTCLWLMPFYPSPNRDNGYDISDYYGVDPRLGDLGDFVDLVRTAREHGIRVILDLVINHTSDQHPWFKSARTSERSPFRDFYVWADQPPDGPEGIVFPGDEHSNWDYDEVAGKWYLHRFYRHMPDLNIANPKVCDELAKVMGFWLELGVSGFRVDAAPFVIEAAPGQGGEQASDPHEFLRTMREFVGRRRGDAILLAEANLSMEEQRRFFGDEGGDEMHMLFDFIRNQRMFLSLVRADARPLADHLRRLPRLPDQCQWAVFVKNHDELTLDKLTEEERNEVFEALAPDESMRIYGRGIRRRVPPMLNGDRRRMKLLYSLLMSQPGTPVLLYGEEIGLGDNLKIEGRGPVRVPMQWTTGPNAGFSDSGEGDEAHRVAGGDFGPERVSVQAQRSESDSMLNWMERLIRLRKELPEMGLGSLRVLDTGDQRVLVHRCDWRGRVVVVLHNFGGEERTVTLDLGGDDEGAGGLLTDLTADQDYDSPAEGREVRLGGYGYRWLRLST